MVDSTSRIDLAKRRLSSLGSIVVELDFLEMAEVGFAGTTGLVFFFGVANEVANEGVWTSCIERQAER